MTDEQGEIVKYCVNHPDVETVVSCGRCGRPVCTRCMIFTPVGVRCRDCAQLRRLPQYELTPRVYARVIPGAIVLALLIGFLLSFFAYYIGFLSGIIVGLLVAAGLRRVSGYKQGPVIEVIAGATVVLAVVSSTVFHAVRLAGWAHLWPVLASIAPQSLGLDALGIVIGIYIAVQQLR